MPAWNTSALLSAFGIVSNLTNRVFHRFHKKYIFILWSNPNLASLNSIFFKTNVQMVVQFGSIDFLNWTVMWRLLHGNNFTFDSHIRIDGNLTFYIHMTINWHLTVMWYLTVKIHLTVIWQSLYNWQSCEIWLICDNDRHMKIMWHLTVKLHLTVMWHLTLTWQSTDIWQPCDIWLSRYIFLILHSSKASKYRLSSWLGKWGGDMRISLEFSSSFKLEHNGPMYNWMMNRK